MTMLWRALSQNNRLTTRRALCPHHLSMKNETTRTQAIAAAEDLAYQTGRSQSVYLDLETKTYDVVPVGVDVEYRARLIATVTA